MREGIEGDKRARMAATTPGLDSRRSAAEALDSVLDDRRPLDRVLAASRTWAALPARDRAFARVLVATTLRRRGQIDRVLARLLERPLEGRRRSLANVLRVGLCQLLFLGTAPHAAVDTTVRLAAARAGGRMGRLANAVLRRVQRDGGGLLAETDPLRDNTPAWLWRGWVEAYGPGTARRIAEVHLGEPPLDLTVKDDAEAWARRLGGRLLPTGSVRRDATGGIAGLPGYDDGAWWVQDAAAALPARLLGPVSGKRAIDLCAAPGGKTAQLAAAGARVTAVEGREARSALLKANLGRLGLAAEVVTADVLRWRPPEAAPAVLLDAPCTATGTIRRRPDVPWNKSPADVQALARVQDRMLDAAAAMVAPGGTLVYAVCSLEPEEGPARVRRFLAARPDFARAPVGAALVGGLDDAVTPEGDLRTLPCHGWDPGGMDGFYAARLVRVGR